MPNVSTSAKKPIFAVTRDAPTEYRVEAISVGEMADRAANTEEAFQLRVAPLLFNQQTCIGAGYAWGLLTTGLPTHYAQQAATWLAQTILARDGDDDNLRKPIIRVWREGKFFVQRLSVKEVLTAEGELGIATLGSVLDQGFSVLDNSILLTNDRQRLEAQFVVLAPDYVSPEQVVA